MAFDRVAATYRRSARWLTGAAERARGAARRRRRPRRGSNARTEPPADQDSSSTASTAPRRPTIPLLEYAANERAAGRAGYRLLPGESVDDGVRRIVGQELASALDDLDVVVVDNPPKAVHDCRRKCKKIRAAVRLVRPAMVDGQYAVINGLARDASRALAPLRDAVAMSETFARLVELTPAGDSPAEAMAAVDAALSERRRRADDELDAGHPAIGRARDLLAELDRAPFWLEHSGRANPVGWDAIGPGVAKTYRRGRRSMTAAVEHGSGERFHDWRKRAKYTRYHLGLLTPTAPVLLDPLEDAFHALTDALGDAHDLQVIDEWLHSKEAARLTGDLPVVRAAVVRMRSELEARAVELGDRLYAEPSRRFSERLGRYWTTWQADRAVRPVGKLDVVVT